MPRRTKPKPDRPLGTRQPKRLTGRITRSLLAHLSILNSIRLPFLVNDNGKRKRWVGIGWVEEEGPANRLKAVVAEDDDPFAWKLINSAPRTTTRYIEIVMPDGKTAIVKWTRQRGGRWRTVGGKILGDTEYPMYWRSLPDKKETHA
jgi:hypothetical protein